MKFKGRAGRYYLLLAGIEALCSKVGALAREDFTVDVRPDALPPDIVTAHGATGYNPTTDVIFINQTAFDELPRVVRNGFVLHEMAHVVAHRRGDTLQLGDCIEADLRVIEWGLGTELLPAAELDCGSEYAAHLRAAQSPGGVAAARDALELWAIQVRAGNVKRPKHEG
jgi:hypothetical protein